MANDFYPEQNLNKSKLNNRNHKNNFTLLRLLAAFFVLISHSFNILQKPLEQPALWYNGKNINLGGIGLGIFFTLSGFLVTQSLFNSDSLKHYAWKRFLRIFPALIVANLVCILAGCFITSLSLHDYLLNILTWTYLFKNTLLLKSQFYLPGVFTNLQDHTVNASLWTISIQVGSYLVLLLAAYVIVIRKWLFLTCFALFEALRVYVLILHNNHLPWFDLGDIFTLGTYFYLGSLFYVFKDNIAFKWFYANILMAVALATVYTFLEPVTLSIFFAYCFILIGTSKEVINFKGYDLSYGVYLYAFPIQQLVLSYFGYTINTLVHIVISSVLAAAVAFLSWIWVETPFLQKKNRFL